MYACVVSRFLSIESTSQHIPWTKVWQIKSFFATPRDQITWLKLMHRNLYLAPQRDNPNDDSCPLCKVKQNQLHLVKCHVIREKLWDPLIKLTTNMGFEAVRPFDVSAFLAIGRRSPYRVISKNQSGIFFLAWRCLYAELVSGRIDDKIPNITNAYKRCLLMTHTRLVAYGEKWLRWVRKNRGTALKSYIPEKHQNKIIIKQACDGSYEINQLLYSELKRLDP